MPIPLNPAVFTYSALGQILCISSYQTWWICPFGSCEGKQTRKRFMLISSNLHPDSNNLMMNEQHKTNLVIEVRSLLAIVPESSRQRCTDLLHYPLVCLLCASCVAAQSSTKRNFFNGTDSFLVTKKKNSLLTISISFGQKNGGTEWLSNCQLFQKGLQPINKDMGGAESCLSHLEVGCSMGVPHLFFFVFFF